MQTPRRPRPRALAQIRAEACQREENRALIREAMSIIGSTSTPAKARAARANGKKGGRPAAKQQKKGKAQNG